MSNWPKRYDVEVDKDGVIIGLTDDEVADGDWLQWENFERLLELAAHEIYHSGMSHDKDPEEVKVRLLKQLGDRNETNS
jgi:succinate dehydrogenase flavin-adding protein (antitoxin of CptAB toxin-antitoxin module)